MALKQTHETDIQQAVGQAVSQYEQQTLNGAVPHSSTSIGNCGIAGTECRCSRFLWQAKGIYLQWVRLKKVWTWGMKFLTMSQAPSTQTRVQQFTSSPDQAFSFQKHMSDLGTCLTDLIWSWMLLAQVLPTSPTSLPPQLPPHSSTPFRGVKSGAVESDFRHQWYSTNQSW